VFGPTDSTATAAVVLTGGRSSRLGRHKPTVEVGGRTMLDAALAATAGAWPLVVVGDGAGVPPGIDVVVERPAGSGPVAGIARGLAHLAERWGSDPPSSVVVLAADLPFVTSGLLRRLAERRASAGAAVAVPVDGRGRSQWLCAVWSVDALTARLAAIDPNGAPVRSLFMAGDVAEVDDVDSLTVDVDTPGDLTAARVRARGAAPPDDR
jgi:molybdopterin-guanine dinucleotide biosynthesis protein A